jgi:hypothetical protein
VWWVVGGGVMFVMVVCPSKVQVRGGCFYKKRFYVVNRNLCV